jgi:hypothetical protein
MQTLCTAGPLKDRSGRLLKDAPQCEDSVQTKVRNGLAASVAVFYLPGATPSQVSWPVTQVASHEGRMWWEGGFGKAGVGQKPATTDPI